MALTKTLAGRSMVGSAMLAALVLAMLALASPARAETFPVETTNDSGPSSLRQAIADANATSEADTIVFGLDAGSTITLSSTLTVTNPLTIEGPGARSLTISGNNAVRPFYVQRTTVNISDITITDGRVGNVVTCDTKASGDDGGAIYNEAGTLTIRNSAVTKTRPRIIEANEGGAIFNLAGDVRLIDSTISGYGACYGGAIHNRGVAFNAARATLTGSTLSDNVAFEGGAIYNEATSELNVTAGSRLEGNYAFNFGGGLYNLAREDAFIGDAARITDSTFAGNHAGGGGSKHGFGGGVHSAGDLVVERSTFSGNFAYDHGGGIHGGGGNVKVDVSTFHGNEAYEGSGGGITVTGDTEATITNCTLTANRTDVRGGGIAAWATTLPTVRGSIVAGNTADLGNPDVVGNHTDGGFNVLGGTAAEAGLQTDADGNPVLAGNGGPTQTVALVRGGAAIDKGNSFGASSDQRGTPRPKDYASVDNAEGGDGSDAGAFEYVDPDATSPTVEAHSSPLPGAGGLNNSEVTVAISASDEEGGSGMWRVSYSTSGAQQITEQNVPGSSADLAVSADGETTVTYWATDRAGNRSESRTLTVRVDAKAPTVETWNPKGNNVSPRAKPTVTFSEKMEEASVEKSMNGKPKTFVLKMGTRVIPATVVYTEKDSTFKAVLKPTKPLKAGVKYTASVTDGAKDLAGNALVAKTWSFKVKR